LINIKNSYKKGPEKSPDLEVHRVSGGGILFFKKLPIYNTWGE
jgi:hypothetical protein